MALEYTLMIQSQLSLPEIQNKLLTLKEINTLTATSFIAPGLTLEIELVDQEDKAFVQDRFGFIPNQAVFFRQEKSADFQLAHSSLLQITVFFLKNSSGDVILDFNGDTVLLRRINRQLFLYQDDSDFWQPTLLHFIPKPYEFAFTQPENIKKYQWYKIIGPLSQTKPIQSPNPDLNQSILLEPAVAQLIKQIALKQQKSMDEIVNSWLKKIVSVGG
ncbi:hypothetical protein BGP_1280 [Beggiatoa sp. PS]|nr:hypothetical protein BGP_1280 [Beggiatoa sp. PS]